MAGLKVKVFLCTELNCQEYHEELLQGRSSFPLPLPGFTPGHHSVLFLCPYSQTQYDMNFVVHLHFLSHFGS